MYQCFNDLFLATHTLLTVVALPAGKANAVSEYVEEALTNPVAAAAVAVTEVNRGIG